MRTTGRLLKVCKDTVCRSTKLAGEHAAKLHDELVAFSPNTDDVQFDEKWDFVYKKEKHCDATNPADARRGDNWDHVALDAEHKLVLEVQNGKRTETNTKELVRKTAQRLQDRVPRWITSDEYKPYKKAVLESFGQKRVPQRTGKRGRPKNPTYRPGKDLVYATVHKIRVKGRVKKIDYRTIVGTDEQVQETLLQSSCSRQVKTSLVECQNGTDRNRCSRKVRKSYCFSKNWDVHGAATRFSLYSYNFCWAVRTWRRPDGLPGACSPAMATGLAEHIWTIKECLTLPERQ
jgi:IS1 family transposase